ncbi:unnamed protein product, partial [Brassica rapa subsp. trilocularis]
IDESDGGLIISASQIRLLTRGVRHLCRLATRMGK